MHPDEEPNLKTAFAELHRRQREQAPPFGAMRERVLREAGDRRPLTGRLPMIRRVAWAAAAVCMAAIATWRGGRLPESASPAPGQADSIARVEQLITLIERHLEFDAATEYPTDSLLAENHTDLSL